MAKTRFHVGLLRAFVLTTLTVGWTNPAAAEIVYGVTGAGGANSSLYSINLATGADSLINAVTVSSTPISLVGITYDSANGTLYGIQSSSNSILVSINPMNGAATTVGSLGGGIGAQSIAYNSAIDSIYVYSKSPGPPDKVYTLSTANGAATLVGSSGLSGTSGNGMGVSPLDGSILLAPFAATGALYTVDPTLGTATLGPTLGTPPLASSQIKALAFDPSGDMYGLDFVPGSPFTTDLVTINPSTGAYLSGVSTQNGLVGLAFVPEPSSFILLGLAGSGMLTSAWVRRRRMKLIPA